MAVDGVDGDTVGGLDGGPVAASVGGFGSFFLLLEPLLLVDVQRVAMNLIGYLDLAPNVLHQLLRGIHFVGQPLLEVMVVLERLEYDLLLLDLVFLAVELHLLLLLALAVARELF